jgi:hypothetical protein
MDLVIDFGRWLAGLDPVFAFLLALPFAVATAGLLVLRHESRAERRARRTAAPRRVSGRPAHVR